MTPAAADESPGAAESVPTPPLTPSAPTPALTPFPLSAVRLLESPFLANMRRTCAYLLFVDVDRLLHTFRLNVGLPSAAESCGGWEAPTVQLRGHTTGHLLSALAQATGRPSRRTTPRMRAYAAFLERQVSGGILDYGLGDWFTPDRTFPRAVAGTYGYWRVVDALSRIAGVLGDAEAAATYRAKADAATRALAAKYYDATTGTFGGGGQGAEALALDMGAYPAGERDRLLGHFTSSVQNAGYHLLLGEISLPAAFRVLSAAGRDDIVHAVATRTTSPSYGYQVRAGNTTLGESWDGGPGQSQNHFMLGAIDSWFTTRVAGLSQTADSVGYAELLVDPAVEGEMTSASASHRTPYGTARTAWQRDADTFRLTLDVPAGSTAEVHVPATEGSARAPQGARLLRTDNTEVVYQIGSGHWKFDSTLPTTGSTAVN
ncbi:hypothetical protein ACZ91_46455 [Streptomyces regensis]|nr:hypothetical protein ACZ91_46455 [Streptomyces regensis]